MAAKSELEELEDVAKTQNSQQLFEAFKNLSDEDKREFITRSFTLESERLLSQPLGVVKRVQVVNDNFVIPSQAFIKINETTSVPFRQMLDVWEQNQHVSHTIESVRGNHPSFMVVEISGLKHLFSRDHFEKLLSALHKNTNISCLVLDSVQLRDTEVYRLAHMLQTHPRITSLSIASNFFSKKILGPVLQLLSGSMTLSSLNLSSNDINGKKLTVLCDFLESPVCHLTTIHLSDNGITCKDLEPFLASLLKNKSLTEIYLLNNLCYNETLVWHIQNSYDPHCYVHRHSTTKQALRIETHFRYTERTQHVFFHL